MLYILLLFVSLLFVYFYFTRRAVDKAIPTKARRKQQNDHLERLRRDRMVNDFVLTSAVFPALDNDIEPQEGYRLYKNDGFYKINGGCLIIASVSAEKMRNVFLSLLRRIGPVMSVSFEDFYSDDRNVIDYLSYDRDLFVVENLFDRYWRMIQNNHDLKVSVFSAFPKVELIVTRVKTINIHVVEPVPFIEVLEEYGLREKPQMRFFIEGTYYAYNDYAGTDTFFRLTSELEVHEKRFYEKREMIE